nr:hypothetical protein [uncultured Psychroserpens sp.]
MKHFLIILSVLAIFLIAIYGGLHFFGNLIYNTQSCNRFNIDNIELRTGVNIPEIVTSDCECKDNNKISKFIIDSVKVDLDDYISKNKFTRVGNLYVKENDNSNSTYKVTFEKQTAELIINLTYKNN